MRADGSVCEPPEWIARHKISVQRALEMLTIEPAYAVSMEEHIGSIKPGKYADLIILSDDPLKIEPDLIGEHDRMDDNGQRRSQVLRCRA